MQEYEILLRMRTDRVLAERRWRHHQLVQDATQKEKAQPLRLRFDVRRWLARLIGFRMQPQDPPCAEAPLSAR